MNSEYLIDENGEHIILISEGVHSFSFKQYFVRKVLCLNEVELSHNVFQSDSLLTSFLKDNDYMGKFSMDDYQCAEFNPIYITNELLDGYPKNKRAYGTLTNGNIFQKKLSSDFDLLNITRLKDFKITLIIQNPYERIIHYFLTHYVSLKTKAQDKSLFYDDPVLLLLGINNHNLSFSRFISYLLNQLKNDISNDLLDFCKKQSIDDELIFEKIINLSNLLVITDDYIDKIFPGYTEFLNKNNYIEGLSTWERVSYVKGVCDLSQYNVCYITKNLIRIGSFNLHTNKILKQIFKKDIDLYYNTKQLLFEKDSSLKQFIVIGCVRSGTTFVNKTLQKYCRESVNENNYHHYFNENLVQDLNRRWSLRTKNFISKQCEDVNKIEKLKAIFPDIKFFYVIRDLRDVIYTINYPSTKSWPPREVVDFPSIEHIQQGYECSLLKAIILFVQRYIPEQSVLEKFKSDIFLIKYEDLLTSSGLTLFLEESSQRLETTFNKNMLKPATVNSLIKPVNHGAWIKFNSTEMNLILGYEFIQEFLDKYNYQVPSITKFYIENITYHEGLLKDMEVCLLN
tara:strand:- start:52811 stop:54514 length:1704 start_codon:yes stop_codon:yes gene_type:complete